MGSKGKKTHRGIFFGESKGRRVFKQGTSSHCITKSTVMKRDGALTSLWQHHMEEFQSANDNAVANKYFDVVIVGGGITGITTGLLLQKAGRKVLIAEAHSICFGTTGGTTAHLNTLFDTPYDEVEKKFSKEDAQLLARATKQSIDLFKRHVNEYNIECGFKEVPAYLYAQTEEQVEKLDKIFEATERAGVEVSLSNTIPVHLPFTKAIEIPGQAQIHPSRYVYALAKEFENAGGVIAQDCRITGVEEGEVLEIESCMGTIRSKYLIYATHIPPGVNILHFRCAPYRSYAMAVRLKNEADYPAALAYDLYDPYHYFRTQEVDGKKYLIVGGEDHKTADETNTEACFTKLEAYLRKYYEVDEISFRWSSQYFEPADGLAYIGHLPGHAQNMFVATGYSGNGITYSHIAAMTLTDLITTGKSDFEKLFNPGRVKPVAGFSNFVKEAVDVVGHFIKDPFTKEKIHSLAELAPGEAKIVKYEGDSIALYKDENGEVHAVSPACSHIKCQVGWNSAEKSWDCPCHGSRYNFDGELLTGPARKDLQQIAVKDLIEEHH
jgi:glycine/D-amino acid oxidase-like deaminating enzyme/nitrite reductase/ring-hydroxylating ferredoxin subunit